MGGSDGKGQARGQRNKGPKISDLPDLPMGGARMGGDRREGQVNIATKNLHSLLLLLEHTFFSPGICFFPLIKYLYRYEKNVHLYCFFLGSITHHFPQEDSLIKAATVFSYIYGSVSLNKKHTMLTVAIHKQKKHTHLNSGEIS